MRLRVLYNPAAGRGRGRRKIDAARRRFDERGAEVEFLTTRDAGHLIELAGSTTAEHCDRLVVCGGDGSVNLAIRKLDVATIPLAVVPTGSGDDFAQTLGIPRDPARAADVAIDGVERVIDIALVNGTRYVCIAGLGFDSEVAAFANGVRRLRGSWVYLYSILRVLPSFRPRRVRVSYNGTTANEEIMFAVVGNTHRYGAGLQVVPTAVVDDGQLDLCLVRRCSILDLVTTLPLAYSGKHVTRPFVALERSPSFRFESEEPMEVFADGERLAVTPVTMTLAPERLRMIVP